MKGIHDGNASKSLEKSKFYGHITLRALLWHYDKNCGIYVCLEEILQVFHLLLLLHCLETHIQQLVLVVESVCVHDTHVMNNVRPYMSEVAYQQVSLLLQVLQRHGWIVVKELCRLGLYLPHCTTWMDEGILVHV